MIFCVKPDRPGHRCFMNHLPPNRDDGQQQASSELPPDQDAVLRLVCHRLETQSHGLRAPRRSCPSSSRRLRSSQPQMQPTSQGKPQPPWRAAPESGGGTPFPRSRTRMEDLCLPRLLDAHFCLIHRRWVAMLVEPLPIADGWLPMCEADRVRVPAESVEQTQIAA